MIRLYNDDCLEVIKTLDENSIDAIVTDPPAGIGFMGSGTTGKAAKELGFGFIGIENDKVYFKIAKKRIGK